MFWHMISTPSGFSTNVSALVCVSLFSLTVSIPAYPEPLPSAGCLQVWFVLTLSYSFCYLFSHAIALPQPAYVHLVDLCMLLGISVLSCGLCMWVFGDLSFNTLPRHGPLVIFAPCTQSAMAYSCVQVSHCWSEWICVFSMPPHLHCCFFHHLLLLLCIFTLLVTHNLEPRPQRRLSSVPPFPISSFCAFPLSIPCVFPLSCLLVFRLLHLPPPISVAQYASHLASRPSRFFLHLFAKVFFFLFESSWWWGGLILRIRSVLLISLWFSFVFYTIMGYLFRIIVATGISF